MPTNAGLNLAGVSIGDHEKAHSLSKHRVDPMMNSTTNTQNQQRAAEENVQTAEQLSSGAERMRRQRERQQDRNEQAKAAKQRQATERKRKKREKKQLAAVQLERLEPTTASCLMVVGTSFSHGRRHNFLECAQSRTTEPESRHAKRRLYLQGTHASP